MMRAELMSEFSSLAMWALGRTKPLSGLLAPFGLDALDLAKNGLK